MTGLFVGGMKREMAVGKQIKPVNISRFSENIYAVFHILEDPTRSMSVSHHPSRATMWNNPLDRAFSTEKHVRHEICG